MKGLAWEPGRRCQDARFPQLHWHLQLSTKEEVSSWLPLRIISHSRMPASQEPIEYLWGVLGMRKYWVLLFCKMLGRWGQPEFPGHEAMAELEIANTTFGIQSVHLTTGPWKQVLKPYGKQLELPSRLKAFANVKRKKTADEVTSPGNFTLWLSFSIMPEMHSMMEFCHL